MILHTPNLASPISGQDGKLTPVWAKYLRELQSAITAELSPGRIAPFYLSAADIADAEQFIQAGATAGLGVGVRLGWALCNGNNDTPSLDGKSLRWSTAEAGVDSGADSVTLAEANIPQHAHAIDHDHTNISVPMGNVFAGGAYALNANNPIAPLSVDVPAYTGNSGNWGTASPTAINTIPVSKTLVPMMRVA